MFIGLKKLEWDLGNTQAQKELYQALRSVFDFIQDHGCLGNVPKLDRSDKIFGVDLNYDQRPEILRERFSKPFPKREVCRGAYYTQEQTEVALSFLRVDRGEWFLNKLLGFHETGSSQMWTIHEYVNDFFDDCLREMCGAPKDARIPSSARLAKIDLCFEINRTVYWLFDMGEPEFFGHALSPDPFVSLPPLPDVERIIQERFGLSKKPSKEQISRFFQESLAKKDVTSLGASFQEKAAQLLDALETHLSDIQA